MCLADSLLQWDMLRCVQLVLQWAVLQSDVCEQCVLSPIAGVRQCVLRGRTGLQQRHVSGMPKLEADAGPHSLPIDGQQRSDGGDLLLGDGPYLLRRRVLRNWVSILRECERNDNLLEDESCGDPLTG